MYQTLNISAEATAEMNEMLSYWESPEVRATEAQERDAIRIHIAQQERLQASDSELDQSTIPHASALDELPQKALQAMTITKFKVKTIVQPLQELPFQGSSEMSASAAAPPVSPPRPSYRLSTPKRARSRDALRLLFPSATADLKGTIHWTNFITALSDLGCNGEHRGGSEWTFSWLLPEDGHRTETKAAEAQGKQIAEATPSSLDMPHNVFHEQHVSPFDGFSRSLKKV